MLEGIRIIEVLPPPNYALPCWNLSLYLNVDDDHGYHIGEGSVRSIQLRRMKLMLTWKTLPPVGHRYSVGIEVNELIPHS